MSKAIASLSQAKVCAVSTGIGICWSHCSCNQDSWTTWHLKTLRVLVLYWSLSHLLKNKSFNRLCQRKNSRKLWILRSEEHTSELQSRFDLVCRLLLEKKNRK